MRKRLLPPLTSVVLAIAGCGTSATPKVAETPHGSKHLPCSAADLTQADQELAVAQGKFHEKEWLEAQRYAVKSYNRCPSPMAAFYHGAALFQDAKERESEAPFNPDFARARCLLEEAIDKYSERPIGHELARDAQAMIADTIKQGATHLEVYAASGTVHVRKGNGQIDERRPIVEERPVDLCVMPGHYDIKVDGIAGKGNVIRNVRRNQGAEVVKFEPRSPKRTERVLQFVVIGSLLLSTGSVYSFYRYDQELSRCGGVGWFGQKCANEGTLSLIQDLSVGGLVAGSGLLIVSMLGLVYGIPPPYQVAKDPRKNSGVTTSLGCFPGLMQVTCRANF